MVTVLLRYCYWQRPVYEALPTVGCNTSPQPVITVKSNYSTMTVLYHRSHRNRWRVMPKGDKYFYEALATVRCNVSPHQASQWSQTNQLWPHYTTGFTGIVDYGWQVIFISHKWTLENEAPCHNTLLVHHFEYNFSLHLMQRTLAMKTFDLSSRATIPTSLWCPFHAKVNTILPRCAL